MHRSFSIRVTVIVVGLLLASGCQQRRGGDSVSGPANPSDWPGFASTPGPIMVGHPVKFSDMTESERKFGIAPKRGPGVEYQNEFS
jgi:hypothetical protein